MPTLTDRLQALAARFPDEVAYEVVDGDRLTFAEWDRTASRLARRLAEAGVQPQDRVALLCDSADFLRFLQAYAAIHKTGGIATLVNVRFSASEIDHLLEHAEPAAAVVSPKRRSLIDELSALPDVLVSTGDGWGGVHSWDDMLDGDDAAPATELDIDLDEDDPADILYTSGTTGRPKAVLSRHGNTVQSDSIAPDEFQDGCWLHGEPLESLGAQSFIYTPSTLGLHGLYLPPPFEPDRWIEAAENQPVTGAFLSPAMVEKLLATEAIEDADLSGLTIVSVGSAPIAESSLRRLNEVLPDAVPQNNYSITELGTAFTAMPDEDFEEHAGSVGLPVDPFEVRIVDPETGEELPAGEVGEVLARHPERREYFRAPELEEKNFEDGWMRTGDLGRRDEDGRLWIVGRTDDLIIRGGYNVYPTVPENALYELDEVAEAAVVGFPHEELGQDVAAFVVPREEGGGLSAEDVETAMKERLGEPNRPGRIEIVDSLPRNPSGKVLKDELRDLLT